MAEIYQELNKLLVFRTLLKDNVIKGLLTLGAINNGNSHEYELAGSLIEWAEENGVTGSIPDNYFLGLLGRDENIVSLTAQRTNIVIDSGLIKAVVHDIGIIQSLLQPTLSGLFSQEIRAIIEDYKPASSKDAMKSNRLRYLADFKHLFLSNNPRPSKEEIAKALIQHYHRYGCGRLAGFSAFRWNAERRELVGVEHSDTVQLQDIIGYEYQKAELVRNSEAFVQGRPANNVLLVGARGTGKSSSVKAVANRYIDKGLRLIEIGKSDFKYLTEIMSALRQWDKKFIIFIDDLSFEEYEAEYKILKSLIDGGVEVRPDNVLIYATSNRRNLVKETWEERGGNELHRQDTINEKISLADRFGITLFYTLPNQEEYFKIVEEIARKSRIHLTGAELRSEALRWEMSHSGRSGRIAKQLIDYLAGEVAN